MRWPHLVSSLCAVLSLTAPVFAQVVESDLDDYKAPPTERRGGFVLGVSAGGGFGTVRGYPNQVGEIGDSAFLQSVDAFSVGNSIWIGGGLRDWLTVALTLDGNAARERERAAASQSIGIRVEGFPLYSLGGEWKDLGIVGLFGAGGALVVDNDEETLADGGIMSAVGFGAFYEPWQFWQFSAGPQIGYTHQFSESLKSYTVTAGLRMVFYGAQP